MSGTLRVMPLGGLGEIGKNMTVVEYGGRIVVVDTGLRFPTAEMTGIDLVLPTDIVAATAFSADAEHDVVAADAIPADRLGLDIGPASAAAFAAKLADARTVFWNGPMGVF